MYPVWFVLIGLVAYGITYFFYSRHYDREVWRPDRERPTPAHEYMDGIRFFPVARPVLWGFQFQGIAGLGPIFGPFIALFYGWIPALIWIIVGNVFIGWLHDYCSLSMSVREEGRTLGPLTHRYISPRARNGLLAFLTFYLILITSVFILLVALFWKMYPSSVIPSFFALIGAIVVGQLLYRGRIGVVPSTAVGLIIIFIGLVVGGFVPVVPALPAGWSLHVFWMIIVGIILWLGAGARLMDFIHPYCFLVAWPGVVGIGALLLGALISPATGVALKIPAWQGVLGYTGVLWKPGPIWPILPVAIACGAISGWHCLLSTSGSSGQVDVETDALPVGGGAMFFEGLLALACLGAFMTLAKPELLEVWKWGGIIEGSKNLIAPWTGGALAEPWIAVFFASWLVMFALTIQLLVTKFFPMLMGEIAGERPTLRSIIGNRFIGPIIVIVIGGIFAYSGAWVNLWLLFGGSNQMLAGLALILVTVYLATKRKPTRYTLIPAIVMIVTCLAALLWEGTVFMHALAIGQPIAKGALAGHPFTASCFNVFFGLFGYVLFVIGLIVAYDAFKALRAAS